MKIYILLLLVGISFLKLSATTYTSAQNGNWLNVTTWSPMGIPVSGDIVIINHAVVLDTSLTYTSGAITINSFGSLIQDSPVRDIWLNGANASFINNGTVTIRSILLSAGNFTNTNDFTVKTVANYIALNNSVSGVFDGVDSLFNDGELNNYGTINIMTFYNDSTINNYGTIQGLITVVDSMYNKGYIFNDSLAIIYADSFTNDGNFWNSGRLVLNQFTNLSGTFSNEHYTQIVDMTNIGTFNNNDSVLIGNGITNLGFVQNFWTANLFQSTNIYNAGTFVNASYLNFSGSMYNDSTFVNQASGLIDLGVSFFNGDTLSSNAYFANLGTFNIGDSYFNFDSIHGYSVGKFIVQDSSVNYTNATMTGAFDFCDLTPPLTPIKIDFNLGSVDVNITYCSTVGLTEKENATTINIYPNPTKGLFSINTSEKILVEIYNTLGEQIVSSSQKQINISSYENGIYLIRLKDLKGNLIRQEKIIKQ